MQPLKEITPLLLSYVLPDDCSEAEQEANPITAEEVVEAIKGGKAVEIKNALIEGVFNLKSVLVEGEITLERTKIRGAVDWSYATFKKVLTLTGSTFENDARLTAVAAEKDIFLDEAAFLGEANFLDLAVTGVFYGPRFKRGAIFSRAIFKKSILFIGSTFEEGEANFVGARIGSAESARPRRRSRLKVLGRGLLVNLHAQRSLFRCWRLFWLGAVTPIGGVAFLLGWLILTWSIWKGSSS